MMIKCQTNIPWLIADSAEPPSSDSESALGSSSWSDKCSSLLESAPLCSSWSDEFSSLLESALLGWCSGSTSESLASPAAWSSCSSSWSPSISRNDKSSNDYVHRKLSSTCLCPRVLLRCCLASWLSGRNTQGQLWIILPATFISKEEV